MSPKWAEIFVAQMAGEEMSLPLSERSVEKKLLAKRYQLLHSGEYEKKQFHIRKLKLFYNGVKIPVDGTALLLD